MKFPFFLALNGLFEVTVNSSQEIQEELEEHDNHVQDAKNLALGSYLLFITGT
jgi:hypothetical protein